MNFSEKMKKVIIVFVDQINKNLNNDLFFLISDVFLEEITAKLIKTSDQAKELCKEIIDFKPPLFHEAFKIEEISGIGDLSKEAILYANLFLYKDFLITKFRLDLVNANSIYLDAALNGSPNYNPSALTSDFEGFENTKITLTLEEAFA